jgi:hypothetical protein
VGAGQELLNLVDHDGSRCRTEEQSRVSAGKFHQPGVGDVLREIPAMLDGEPAVLDRVQDKCRGTDDR